MFILNIVAESENFFLLETEVVLTSTVLNNWYECNDTMVRSKQISIAAIQRQKTLPERPRIVAEEKHILMYSYLDKACCKSNGTASGRVVHKKLFTNPFCLIS